MTSAGGFIKAIDAELKIGYRGADHG